MESVHDDRDLDPLFRSLLKHHWMEEAQHAKLDTLMVEALAEGRSVAELVRATEGYLMIGGMLDAALKTQTELDLGSFRAGGRPAPKSGQPGHVHLSAASGQPLDIPGERHDPPQVRPDAASHVSGSGKHGRPRGSGVLLREDASATEA